MSHWLLIYDISDPKRLRKVAKIANAFGNRVQRSVFELSCSRETIETVSYTHLTLPTIYSV